VLVDRGFLADEAMAQFKPAGAAVDEPIVGVLRSPSAKSVFTPGRKADHAFFSREIAPIAAAVGARDPAPVFFMLESPKPQGFGPTPAPVPTDIPNNHLGYALTWFGLAAGLLGVYIASLLKRRKT
jgi:surfeit locus 1 family protein